MSNASRGFTLIELACGDCDHRRIDRTFIARSASGPRGREAGAVREQHEATRPGDAQLRKLERSFAAPDGDDTHDAGTVTWKSAFGPSSRITPYIELSSVFNAINYTNKNSDPSNATAVATQPNAFLCPSEINQQAFVTTSMRGVITAYGVSNYGWCVGTWYTFGGYGAMPNPSAFCTNISRTFASFTDGLSNTVLGSEVKTYRQAYHNCSTCPAAGAFESHGLPRCSNRARQRGRGPNVGLRADHRPCRVCQAVAILSGATATLATTVSRRPYPRIPFHRAVRQPSTLTWPRQMKQTAARRMPRLPPVVIIPAVLMPCLAMAAFTGSRTRSTSKRGEPGHNWWRRGDLIR